MHYIFLLPGRHEYLIIFLSNILIGIVSAQVRKGTTRVFIHMSARHSKYPGRFDFGW